MLSQRKHRGRCYAGYSGCHAVGSEKNNLLEFLEPSVRGEALAQSNSTRISDIVVLQTAKPQKKRKKKSCQISQNIAQGWSTSCSA